jgi:hypothetical protein
VASFESNTRRCTGKPVSPNAFTLSEVRRRTRCRGRHPNNYSMG